MKRMFLAPAIGALMIATASPALAQYGGGNRRPAYGYGSVDTRRIGYDNGFREGITEGEKDGRSGDRFRYQDEGDFKRADVGYRNNYGNRDMYRQSFRSGFADGYADGYRRYSRNGQYGNDRYGYGGGGYGSDSRYGYGTGGGIYGGDPRYGSAEPTTRLPTTTAFVTAWKKAGKTSGRTGHTMRAATSGIATVTGAMTTGTVRGTSTRLTTGRDSTPVTTKAIGRDVTGISQSCGSKRRFCTRFRRGHDGRGAPPARSPERSGARGPRERRRPGSPRCVFCIVGWRWGFRRGEAPRSTQILRNLRILDMKLVGASTTAAA